MNRFTLVDLDAQPDAAQVNGHLNALEPFWHPVARVEKVEQQTLIGVKLLGRELVLARLDGKMSALGGYCRHFQARLALGDVCSIDGHQHIRCAYHGWSYGNDGQCRHIPQLPAGKSVPAGARVPSYHVAEAHGLVWVCLADEPAHALPAFPEAADEAFRTVTLDEPTPTSASAMRMILATLDDTHFPWVHEGILGSRDAPAPPDHRVWKDGEQLHCKYQIVQPANYTSADDTGESPEEVALTYSNTVYMPGAIRLVKDSPAGRYVIWLACSPADAFTTVNFWAFSRNFDLDPARDAEYAAFSQTIRDQDKPLVESQRPQLVPPLSSGVSLGMSPADEPLLEYIRWLEELGITVAP